jgi:hypothetical protein
MLPVLFLLLSYSVFFPFLFYSPLYFFLSLSLHGFLRASVNFLVITAQYTFANPVTANPDVNMKNGKFCSHLSIFFGRHMTFKKVNESLVSSEKLNSFLKHILLCSNTITNSESSFDG